MKRRSANAAIAALLVAAVPLPSQAAENYPVKPIRLVVPFGAGGGTDIQARLFGKVWTESMGQSVVVDNRAGASGWIGAEMVARAKPDGYTLLMTTASLAVNVSLYRKKPIDPLTQLAPIGLVSSVPLVLVARPQTPGKNLKEFLDYVKANPGKVNYASNGSGTTSHLSGEMLKSMLKADMTHIPFKGGGPAMTGLLSGQADVTFGTALVVKPHIQSGRVRGLAVTTAKPASAFPDLPTMASLLPGFETDNWYSLFAPAGTPRALIERLNRETVKALASPEIKAYMAREGADPVGSSPEGFAAFFRKEIAKYEKVVKAANAQVD